MVGLICRRQNGEVKPLTVPKDIDLHLEKAPVNALDALGEALPIMPVESLVLAYTSPQVNLLWVLLPVLRFFLEYQWLVDFAVYAAGVFLFTECYYSVVDASKEVNIGAIWCVLTVLFGLYPSSLTGERGASGGGSIFIPAQCFL